MKALAFAVPYDDGTRVKELLAVDDQAREAALHEVERTFPGLPVTVALTGLALGIFVLGGAGIGLGALLASFCFLGMNVVADILLLAGAALVAAALGLLLLFFAVWFFLRGVVGFADLIIRKGRDWCYEHGEVDA